MHTSYDIVLNGPEKPGISDLEEALECIITFHKSGKESHYRYDVNKGFITEIIVMGGTEEVTVYSGAGRSEKRSLTSPP